MQLKPMAIIAVLSLVVASIFTAGCTVNFSAPAPTATQTTVPTTITQTLSSDASLSTFAHFLSQANLTGVLDGPGNFTVFAPDNTAFSTVDVSTLASWQSNTTALKNVLLYHIIPQKLVSNDFTGSGTLTTLLGSSVPLPYSVTGATLNVGVATVTKADINATNGVIHKIDTVLIPPATK
jgi:transforming growth factor-beta-induced protein